MWYWIFFFVVVGGGLFVLFFLRDPERIPPFGDVILSPADGVVIEVSSEDTWVKIAIFMNLLNVHVQWVPYPGKVISIEKVGGAAKPGFLKHPKQNRVHQMGTMFFQLLFLIFF